VKVFSPVHVFVFALLLVGGSVGGVRRANAEPASVATLNAGLQDSEPEASSSSLSGSWQMSWTNKEGNQMRGTMQLKQSGSKLSGSVQTERGTFSLSGDLKGSQVSITVKAPLHKVSFTGTFEARTMNGTTAQGKPWSATRQ
jgi:hypothetical protein